MKLKTFKTIVFVIAAILLLCSCQKEFRYMQEGDSINFTAGSGFSQTKAAYSGVANSAGTIERIDWQEGDLLRIYCAQASEPSVHYADYSVKSVDTLASGSMVSTAHIEPFSEISDDDGLCWGEGDHTFYAVFPSPATTGGITTSISGSEVSANISGSQAPVNVINSGVNYMAVADLRNMLMTAKAGPYTAETMPDEDHVFLAFTPLTTAVKFTITNQTKAALTLKSVSLTSASSPLTGPFSVDIDDESNQPETVNLGNTVVSYDYTYPNCQYTGSTSSTTKTVTLNFATPITLAYDADIANCGSLTFTFFLQPCDNFNDLTFKLVKSDDSWMSTKLGYTDGTGILFPRFKKTEVNGVFVPEGAQWTVKYGPTVQSWDTDTDDINPMPETGGDPFVTSWDTVDDELELTDPYNGHEYVEIAGLKWATCNVGANTPKDYGWYFSWAGKTGYVRDGTKWVTAQGGSELSGGFSWANTPYHEGIDPNHNWKKYIPTGKTTYWSGGGSPDSKLSLELVDDAARANWGGSWRMPTQAEFQKLYEACGGTGNSCNPPALPSANPGKGIYWVSNSQTYISDYNGVTGILFCDGVNKLFFVVAGYGVDGNLNDEGFSGRYWSGSVYSNPPYNAYYMSFVSNNVKTDDANGRKQGFPVRPVSD